MPREINGPSNTPQPPKLPGVGQGGVRSGYDQKNGNGQQQQKKAPEPEPEPEKEEDEEGHLDADTFARKRMGSAKDFLTDERMPWEVAAEERRKKLEDMRKGRAPGTGPLSAARQQQAAPKGLPPRHQLGREAGPAPKQPPPTGGPGRQVETAWDANAAVNATFNAYQQIKERQEERDRQTSQNAASPGAGAPEGMGGILAKGPSLNRDAISAARAGDDPDEAPAASGPSWLAASDEVPEVPVAKPRAGTGPLNPAARPILGKQPAAEPPRPKAPKLQTGMLSNPAPQARDAKGAEPPRADRQPLSARQPIEPEAKAPVFPDEAPAPTDLPADEPILEEAALLEELIGEAITLEELIEEEPMLEGLIPRLNDNTRLMCRYLIMDAASEKALAGARLEFEPTQDDRLAVVNGQADYEGMYEGEGVAPGIYQLTVRAPGYIPHTQTVVLKAGEVDEGVIHLKKP